MKPYHCFGFANSAVSDSERLAYSRSGVLCAGGAAAPIAVADDDELNINPPTPCQAPIAVALGGVDDDYELNTNPPTPCQIGKRPPEHQNPKDNRPAIRES